MSLILISLILMFSFLYIILLIVSRKYLYMKGYFFLIFESFTKPQDYLFLIYLRISITFNYITSFTTSITLLHYFFLFLSHFCKYFLLFYHTFVNSYFLFLIYYMLKNILFFFSIKSHKLYLQNDCFLDILLI